MALFADKKDPAAEVKQLREQGLTDFLIMDELAKKGYPPEQIHAAISMLDLPEVPVGPAPREMDGQMPTPEQPALVINGNQDIYGRIEEIAEGMIDERWDQLIMEVRKIIEWKGRVEDKQRSVESDVAKLKEDFKILHSGVLGKLENYDTRMQDVGVELKAVGKVFKDVIPTFVENVKELSHLTKSAKGK